MELLHKYVDCVLKVLNKSRKYNPQYDQLKLYIRPEEQKALFSWKSDVQIKSQRIRPTWQVCPDLSYLWKNKGMLFFTPYEVNLAYSKAHADVTFKKVTFGLFLTLLKPNIRGFGIEMSVISFFPKRTNDICPSITDLSFTS